MPHLYNNMAVLTMDDLVPRFFKNEKSLSVICKRSERRGYGIKRVQMGGNGRQMLIDYDSLPSHLKAYFPDPRQVDHVLLRFYKPDSEALEFYTNYRFEDDSMIDEQVVQKYTINASVLKALAVLKSERERIRISMGGSLKGILTGLAGEASTFNNHLEKGWGVRHTLPEHPARFSQTFKKFTESGYAALISKRHGNQNSRKVNDDTEELLINMFADWQTKPSFAEVNRQYEAFLDGYVEVVNQNTGELYDPKAYSKISPSTIYRYLSMWTNKVATYTVRSGDRQQLMGKFKPYHSLDAPTYAGSIISIDDRQPPFEYDKGKRMWFYVGIDLASECYTTAVWGKTKEGIILDFYRQMVRNYAAWGMSLPWELEAERSLNSSFEQTFLMPGRMFQEVRIEANNARGKRIEQYFRPLRYGIEKKAEGWLARPFARDESNQVSSGKVPYIPYDRLVQERLLDIEKWNNQPHSRHPEMTRWEYFRSRQHPELKPINWRGILRYLGEQTITSCNLGIVRLQRAEWLLATSEPGQSARIATGDKLISLMDTLEGRNIDVYWLAGNNGEILRALAYSNGRYVCELLPKPTYNRAKLEQTPADHEARALMSAYVATIEGFRKRRVKDLDGVRVTDTRPPVQGGFKMPVYTPVNGNAYNGNEEWEQPEVLPEPDTDDFNDIEKGFKTNLKDRF